MISERTQATLLLTARLTGFRDESTAAKPLDVSEWNTLARWLGDAGRFPEDLVTADPSAILDGWANTRIGKGRLLALLERGHALAVSLDRWISTGMWIIARSEPAYPEQLRRRLGPSAPPILFGYGDERRLRDGGVAIVGSRDAKAEELQRAADLGAKVCNDGYNVVSGGARGIDEMAAKGAFHGQGTAIVVVADSLLKQATRKHYRDAVLSRDLALITPFSPEAGFSTGNAMGRNKLIYCLADAAVVISSTKGSGGTFTGASENLKKGWVPLWVAPTDAPESGNGTLVERGGSWLPELSELRLKELFTPRVSPAAIPSVEQMTYSLFDSLAVSDAEPIEAEKGNGGGPPLDPAQAMHAPVGRELAPAPMPVEPAPALPSLYDCFIEHWRRLKDEPITTEALAQEVGLVRKQAQEWISRAVQEGLAMKLVRPVRYGLVEGGPAAPSQDAPGENTS